MVIFIVYLFTTIVLGLVARIFYLIFANRGRIENNNVKRLKTLIILGSGGHTTEMLRIVRHLDFSKYTPRVYVYAQTDRMSPTRVTEVEENHTDYRALPIFRSREVGQSYVTSVVTTLIAFSSALRLLLSERPNLILCNGPGTGVPLCLGAFIFRVFYLCKTKIIFVESFCRVKRFSLTGKILYLFADNIIVQWPELCNNSKHVHLIK